MEVTIVLVSTAEDLGRLLREARKRAGMTQAELAGRIATSRQILCRRDEHDRHLHQMSTSHDILTNVIADYH